MELIQSLHVAPTVESVHHQLRARQLRPQESAIHYMLEMQRIAKQIVVSEQELINIIIDGLGDPSLTAGLRYVTPTMDDLRRQLKCFEAARLQKWDCPENSPSSA